MGGGCQQGRGAERQRDREDARSHSACLLSDRGPSTHRRRRAAGPRPPGSPSRLAPRLRRDRKSTRLNSSHGYISYAVFCLKKKKIHLTTLILHAVVEAPLHLPPPIRES